jgi:hypothetical protein
MEDVSSVEIVRQAWWKEDIRRMPSFHFLPREHGVLPSHLYNHLNLQPTCIMAK